MVLCYVTLRYAGVMLVISKSLRSQVINIAHERHQGEVKTKKQLRQNV